jgi:uncharacterized repeat protein (TIGR02543 family)
MSGGSDIHRILFNKLDLNNMKEGFNTAQTITVTLNMNGASGAPVGTVSGVPETVVTSLPTVGTMVKNGYVFMGWSTTQLGTTLITSYKITTDASQTLYAVWTQLYAVTFDINGATSGSNIIRNVPSGSSPSFPLQGELSKTGYTFEGWSLNANGTGNVYKSGATYTITQATTFYAVWATVGPEGPPGPRGPQGPVGYSNIEYSLIDNENNYLQKEIDALIDSTSNNSRKNTYFSEDNMFVIYVNRMLFIVYIGIYLTLIYSLYLNRQTTGTTTIIIIAVVFLLLPYAIDAISKFMYEKFIMAMRLLYKGNAFFLYELPKKTDTL